MCNQFGEIQINAGQCGCRFVPHGVILRAIFIIFLQYFIIYTLNEMNSKMTTGSKHDSNTVEEEVNLKPMPNVAIFVSNISQITGWPG